MTVVYQLATIPLQASWHAIKLGTKSIPLDPDNRDYQEYLEWVAEGCYA